MSSTNLINVGTERRVEIYRIVADGSDPRPAFFFLVATSVLIAAFGLILNSAAVVIGAMLVAPLMMPIFGIALSLLRGSPKLLGKSLRAEILGVVVAIAVSFAIGMMLPYYEITPEMLSRTSPTLLDLLVAVFAGLAGAYAIVDEKISPALPGVAISTAIVPPLANCGLCLSLGAYTGAWGSFLLFFTNFLSILLVTAIIFYLAGMTGRLGERPTKTMAKRFGLAAIGFLIVLALLTGELGKIVQRRRLTRDIRAALTESFGDFEVIQLSKLVHQWHDDTVFVMAQIEAPQALQPRHVNQIEQEVSEAIRRPVSLVVRTRLTKDVSSTGSEQVAIGQSLDGFFLVEKPGVNIQRQRLAAQIIREFLNERLGLSLTNVQTVSVGNRVNFVAAIGGVRQLRRDEIGQLELLIQDRMPEVDVSLAIQQSDTALKFSDGVMRTEMSPRAQGSLTFLENREALLDHAAAYFSTHGFSLEGYSLTRFDGTLYALFEVRGPGLIGRDEVKTLSESMREAASQPVKIYVRSVPEAVVTDDEVLTFEALMERFGERTRKVYHEQTQELIESAR